MNWKDKISKEQWAYLAGFMDGEGCITFPRGRPTSHTLRPRIRIPQTDPRPIAYLHKTFRVGRVRKKKPPPNGFSKKHQMEWAINAKEETRFLLEGMLPYLILKKEKAELALRNLDELAR